MVGRSLRDSLVVKDLAMAKMALSVVQIPSLSSADLLTPALRAPMLNGGGLLGGFNAAKALLSVVEPHFAATRALQSDFAFSGVASLQPFFGLTAYARQMNASIAETLTALTPLPDLVGAIVPGMTKMLDYFAIRPLLSDLMSSHLTGMLARVRSVADWASRLKPPVLAEARYAYEAYIKGNPEPMKQFLYRCLRLWPVAEDHCQALAVAMYEGCWEQEADLTDDQSVRKVLSSYARQGNGREYDRVIHGKTVGYIPDGWHQPDPGPGPEDQAISRLLPWEERFESSAVRHVVRQLNEQQRAVVRAWAENPPVPWTVAPALVQQNTAQGEHSRRKLIRLGQDVRRRENNRRELP